MKRLVCSVGVLTFAALGTSCKKVAMGFAYQLDAAPEVAADLGCTDGVACDDGDACTTGDACSGGVCRGGPPADCDDGNGCTDDACDPAAGCTHADNTLACDDGDACTTADVCAAGACVGGQAPDCDDGNGCTDDACDPAAGCTHAGNTLACDDGDACTTTDVCSSGACLGGPAPDCDDGNGCTDDRCDAVLGCVYADNARRCDDGDACTTTDTCSAGACIPGPAPNCNDGNPCTADGCAADGSCLNVPNVAACDDYSVCTVGDSCSAGACVGGPRLSCDDGLICTTDTCHAVTGCQHTANANACDDRNACTTVDVCSGGLCTGAGSVDCDDGNVCTDDSCDATTGCAYAFNSLPCDDGDPGTVNDGCFNGSCVGNVPVEGRPFQILAAQSDSDLQSRFENSVILTVPPDASFTPVPVGATGVILVGDYVMAGISSLGQLNTGVTLSPRILGWNAGGTAGQVPLPNMTGGYPNQTSGFAFRAAPALDFEEDVLSPGCLCEGWGVRFSSGGVDYDGGAAQSGNALTPATPVQFATTYDNVQKAWFVRARAAVGPMEIITDISLRRADRYVSLRVALRNTGASLIANVRFIRSLDFDVGPGHYSGDSFDFLYALGVPQLIRAHDEIDPPFDPDPTPNDNFYGVATVSPYMTCADGFTFMTTDPDPILSSPECNVDPVGALGDYSSSFVFEPYDIPIGGAAEL